MEGLNLQPGTCSYKSSCQSENCKHGQEAGKIRNMSGYVVGFAQKFTTVSKATSSSKMFNFISLALRITRSKDATNGAPGIATNSKGRYILGTRTFGVSFGFSFGFPPSPGASLAFGRGLHPERQ